MNRVLPFAATLIILLQVGLLGLGFARANDSDELEAPIYPTAEPQSPVDLEAILPFATGVAADWRGDSQLVGASMQIDWPHEPSDLPALSLPQGGWIFLAFLSKSDLLTMRIDRASGIIVQTSVIALGERAHAGYASQAVDLAEATTSSGTAALAAEAAYGSAFRYECPDQRFTSWLTARRGDESTPVWHVEYKSVADVPQPSLKMDIDWQSGQIENVANASEPCA